MLTITGEVRKVLPDQYKNRDGNQVDQAILIIEPEAGRQNYNIYLSAKQVQAGAAAEWEKLRGQQATVPVSLYVSYEHRFHKYNASGTGMP